MKRTLALLTLAVAALAAAGPAPAARTAAGKGVVVAKSMQRETVAIAAANGDVRTARSGKAASLRIGDRLAVRGVGPRVRDDRRGEGRGRGPRRDGRAWGAAMAGRFSAGVPGSLGDEVGSSGATYSAITRTSV
jgi:hypothetical protein